MNIRSDPAAGLYATSSMQAGMLFVSRYPCGPAAVHQLGVGVTVTRLTRGALGSQTPWCEATAAARDPQAHDECTSVDLRSTATAAKEGSLCEPPWIELDLGSHPSLVQTSYVKILLSSKSKENRLFSTLGFLTQKCSRRGIKLTRV